jgi:cobaltochelatase CobN
VGGSLLSGVNISLSIADANEINEINELLNKTVSPEGTGSGGISGTILATTPGGVITGNGNYVFSELPAGNYTAIAFQHNPYVGWCIARVNVTVGDSLLSDVNISLSIADANGINEINELSNKIVSPEGTGSGGISGTILATTPGGVITVADATVVLSGGISGTILATTPGGVITVADATVVLIKEETAVEPEPLFAKTTSDSNGNYIFSELPAGNYTIIAFQHNPYVGWCIARVNVTVGDSLLSGVNISLSIADANGINEINELSNKTVSPEGTGSGGISGTLLATTPGGVVTVPDATVVLIKEKPEPLFAKRKQNLCLHALHRIVMAITSFPSYLRETIPQSHFNTIPTWGGA